MERIVERPGALDVHKESVMACVRVWEGREVEEHTAEFQTTVQGLLALRDWLEALGVKQVAMEATGKHGYGFHPLHAYADETREALGAILRPGNAGSNTAADHKTVIDLALAQIPAEQIESIEILVRADSAGATHETAEHCYEGNLRFSFGYELSETVRTAILETPDEDWIAALDQDDSERTNGQVVEITARLDLSTWPKGPG
jgi:Transposase DDE domain group 1